MSAAVSHHKQMTKTLLLFSFICLLLTVFCFSGSYTEAKITPSSPPVDSLNDDFYNVIIENNLFRPLGWQPPRRIIPYKLLATITYAASTKKHSSAILAETSAVENTHYVTIGDKIGETLVVKIEPKQVTLHIEGKEVVLRVNGDYLNTSDQKRRAVRPVPTFIHSDPAQQKIFIPPHTASVPDWVRKQSFR